MRTYAQAASSQAMVVPTFAVTPPDSHPSLSSASGPNSPTMSSPRPRDLAKAKHTSAQVVLDLKNTDWDGKDTAKLSTLMNQALRRTKATEKVKCQGVRLGPKERVGFVFRDDQVAQQVVTAEPWTKSQDLAFNRARVATLRSYKVKIRRVNEQIFNSVQPGAKVEDARVQEIAKENGVAIREIRRLTPAANGRALAVIFCPTRNDQEKLLEEGCITVRGEWAPTEEFYESPKVRQCFKCWGFDHNAASCKGEEICIICAATDHKARDCSNTPKCANCSGPHAANDRSCYRRPGQERPHTTSDAYGWE